MALSDPTAPPFSPAPAFWDEDLDRQLAEFATGAPAPALTPEEESAIVIHNQAPALTPQEEEQIEILPPTGAAPAIAAPPPAAAAPPVAAPAAPVQVAPDPMPPEEPDTQPAWAAGLAAQAPDSLPDIGGLIAKGAGAATDAISAGGQDLWKSREESATGDELGDMWSKLSPEEQLEKRAQVDGAKEDFKQAALIDAGTKAKQQALANAQAYEQSMRDAQQRMSRVNARAQQLASEKIDPLKDIGAAKAISGVLMGFLGGFVANKTGRNTGLEQIDQWIDRSVQTQTQNLQHQKDMLGREENAISEEMAQGKDLREAQETVRLATYDSLIAKAEADYQNFDPRGTAALKRLDAINQIKAMRASAVDKAMAEEQKRRQQDFENRLKMAELELKQGEFGLKRQQFAAKQTGAGAAKPVKPDDVERSPEYFEKVYGTRPPMPMSQNGFEQWAKTGKIVEDRNKAVRENSPEEDRKSVV